MNYYQEAEKKLPLSEILGKPEKGIIFSDLDGVWFDEENNFASPTSKDLEILQVAREAGYWIVLNSDSATAALNTFSQQLGCNPIVIGENGAIIEAPQAGIKEYLSPWKSFFDQYKKDTLSRLFEEPNTAIFAGDATSFIKQNPSLPSSHQTAYIINTARECSMGVYTRTIASNGNLEIDDNKTQITEIILSTLLEKKENGDLECTRYPFLGSCLVRDPSQQKWIAIKWLTEQFPTDLSYYMIGDTKNDSMQPLEGKIKTCAVGNADLALKNDAKITGGIIAPENYSIAKGANYIIRKILKGET